MRSTSLTLPRMWYAAALGVLLSVAVAGPAMADRPSNLDSSYGTDGRVASQGQSGANDMALQADDKAVVIGTAPGDSHDGDFEVRRFDRDGEPDKTFGRDGAVITPISDNPPGYGRGDGANTVAIQTDGKIVVAGHSLSTGHPSSCGGSLATGWDFAVVRYLSDGQLDTSFADDGKVVTDFAGSCSDLANDAAILSDNSIVVAGRTCRSEGESGHHCHVAVARYDSLGAMLGTVVTPVATDDEAAAVTVQGDDILVAATSYAGNETSQLALLRYDADLSLDRSFGAGGIVRTPAAPGAEANDAVVQSDGKIVLAGGEGDSAPQSVLYRYAADGAPDAGFGTKGKVVTAGSDYYGWKAVALRGRAGTQDIVAAGSLASDFAVARFAPDGELDQAFGDGGLLRTDFFGSGDAATAAAIQSDDKLVVAGNASTEPTEETESIGYYALARYVDTDECADAGPDKVAIYEHAGYRGRCVLKGIGRYDNADSFAPLPENSASSIRVGDDVTAVLASDPGLSGDSEKFTGDDPDFSDNAPLADGTSSFKVQRRASSDYWSVTLSTAGKAKHWIGDVGIVVSARLRTVGSGGVEGVPNRRLSFVFRSQSTGASGMKCVPVDCLTNAVGVVAWRYDAQNPGVDQIVAYYDEDANGTYDAGEPHAVSSVEWSYARYLALGDSFSSGEGIPKYEPGTDIDDKNECHRSIWQPRGFPGRQVWTGAYSGFISRELRLAEGGSLGFEACSGAVIANVLRDSQWEGELPQLDHVKEQRPDLITITIGGNDAGFGMVLDACVTSGLIGVPCNPSLDGSVRRAIAGMNLKDVYVALKQAAPDARVIVLGYPHLFQTPSNRYCYVLAKDANWMNAMTDELNAKIRRSISDANQELADNKISGVEYANQTDAFRGHELCTDLEWVIDPIQAGGSVASFHPEPAGQQALARKLWSTITGN